MLPCRPKTGHRLNLPAVPTARRVFADLVLKALARGLQSHHKALDLDHVDVFIVGVPVNQQRRIG